MTMPNKIQEQAKDLLEKVVSSVHELVDDITALEINTMVVEQITGAKFNAWQAYEEIYSINDKDYFDVKGIPNPDDLAEPEKTQAQELRKRYTSLFSQLEREYFYILLEKSNESSEPDSRIIQYQERLKYQVEHKANILPTDEVYIKLARPILPAPTPVADREENNLKSLQQRWKEIEELLNNDKFIRTLRKMSELKAALNSGNITSVDIDIIYAQTVMQLDGDIISRYHKKLFQLSEGDRDLILKIHNEGVVAGEKQWRGTLDFLIGIIQNIAKLSRQ
jgi:chemotaxis regulatin CheY-phosphate phosphatase CheZ